jgi:adenosylmethionine-8-amino-7-oxononanoate aminotransferase
MMGNRRRSESAAPPRLLLERNGVLQAALGPERVQAAFEGGLACYPAGGTVDGKHGDHVLLAPPYISTPDEIDMIVDRLGSAVDTALRSINH